MRPPEEAQQLLAMVFINLLGELVKVVNGGDHSERERERETSTIMHNLTDFTINLDDLNARSSKSKANIFLLMILLFYRVRTEGFFTEKEKQKQESRKSGLGFW